MSKRVRPLHASGYDSFDMFCGAGGFSEGVSRRGVNVKAAANHERICIESHNSNFPLADHYLTDVSLSDMRKFPRARLLFASPECTDHSLAKGSRRKNQGQFDLWGDDGLDPTRIKLILPRRAQGGVDRC